MSKTKLRWKGRLGVFSNIMAQKMDEAEAKGKGDWLNHSTWTLFHRLEEEVEELREALLLEKDHVEVGRECADVANLALMVYDAASQPSYNAQEGA